MRRARAVIRMSGILVNPIAVKAPVPVCLKVAAPYQLFTGLNTLDVTVR